MKTKKVIISDLMRIRSTLVAAISELDIRCENEQITKSLCIIDATFAAVISGEKISPRKVFKRGMVLSSRRE
jgi:hypothetical protein